MSVMRHGAMIVFRSREVERSRLSEESARKSPALGKLSSAPKGIQVPAEGIQGVFEGHSMGIRVLKWAFSSDELLNV